MTPDRDQFVEKWMRHHVCDEDCDNSCPIADLDILLDALLATERVALQQLNQAIIKFFTDINTLPPWHSAAALWGLRIRELNGARLDILEAAAVRAVLKKQKWQG